MEVSVVIQHDKIINYHKMDWFVRYWLRYFSLGFDLHIWLQAPETGKRAPDQTKKAFTRSRVVVCKDNKARKLFLNIPPLILSLYTSQENHARLGPLLYEMISWYFLFFNFFVISLWMFTTKKRTWQIEVDKSSVSRNNNFTTFFFQRNF